jgi:hypothetical protein
MVQNVSCPVHSTGPYKILAPLDPEGKVSPRPCHEMSQKSQFRAIPLRESQISQRICNLYPQPDVIEEVEVGVECCTQGGDGNCIGLRDFGGKAWTSVHGVISWETVISHSKYYSRP